MFVKRFNLSVLLVSLAALLVFQAWNVPAARSADAGKGGEVEHLALARKVFAENRCSECHFLTDTGHFGYTSKGDSIRRQGEGCVDLLTSVTQAVQTPEDKRTKIHKRDLRLFGVFGCTTCHAVGPNHIGLTERGKKLADWHMSCPEVESILNKRH